MNPLLLSPGLSYAALVSRNLSLARKLEMASLTHLPVCTICLPGSFSFLLSAFSCPSKLAWLANMMASGWFPTRLKWSLLASLGMGCRTHSATSATESCSKQITRLSQIQREGGGGDNIMIFMEEQTKYS